MSTTKSRLNISLPDDVKKALLSVAERDQMPAATKALRLMEIGLEVEEDDIWDKIAVSRDREDSVFQAHAAVFEK
ncbi:MAG TPA: hypothetical protein VGG13_00150 [Candidatus Saccharimonadales bacterium]|jgi:hypothetical protein